MYEAYTVAVRLSLVNGVTAGLMGISSAFARVHGDARKLRRELDAIKLNIAAGAALGGVGFFGLNAIAKTVAPAKEYAHQLALMNTAGMKQAEIANSINAAWRANKAVPTATAAQNLAAVQNFRATLGSTEEAINFLPRGQQLAYILANSRGMKNTSSIEGQTAEASAFARALDIRNATTDAVRLNRESELMLKAIVGSGGQLSASDFNTVFRISRATGKGWNDEFAYRVLPSLIQELKTGRGNGAGGGPAAGLVSASQAIVGGKLTNVSLAEFMRLGLVDPGKIIRTSTGNVKGIDKGGIIGSDVFQANPYQWAQTILRPAMMRAGIDTEKEMRASLGQLFRVRTAEGVMSSLLLETRQIERDRRLFQSAKGFSAYETLMKTDPMAADAALAAQWKNLLAQIGFQILPVLVRGTLGLVDGLRGLANWMREHPRLTKGIVFAFAGLSAALAFSGTVLILRGAFLALGLSLRVMGVAKLFTLAQGVTAVASASAAGGAAAPGLLALGSAILGFVGMLSLVALPAGLAVAGAVAERRRDQRILANPSAATPMERAILRRKLESEKGLRDMLGLGVSYKGASYEVSSAGVAQDLDRLRRGSAPKRADGDPLSNPFKLNGGVASPFARGAPTPIFQPPDFTLNMDGRKVGQIVSGHQARGMGAQRVAGGRHDPAVTPASPAGVQRQ